MSPQMSCAWLAPPLAMVLDSGLVVRRAASESALCQWLILNSRFQVSRCTHGSLFPDRASSFFDILDAIFWFLDDRQATFEIF